MVDWAFELYIGRKSISSLVMKNTARPQAVEEMVADTVNGSALSRSHGQELSFVLPLNKVDTFPVLFQKVRHSFVCFYLILTLP